MIDRPDEGGIHEGIVRTRNAYDLLRLKAQSGAGRAVVPWFSASPPLAHRYILLQPFVDYHSQVHCQDMYMSAWSNERY